jgi:hypothetical protein
MRSVFRVPNLVAFLEWCETYRAKLHSGQYLSPYKRKYVELGYIINLSGKCTLTVRDERAEQIARLCGCHNPAFLLCFYEKGGGILPHRDSKGYGTEAFCLSSTDYIFVHDEEKYECRAGVIYQFDSKKVHSVPPLKEERWCLLWWEAPLQLSLF